MVDLVNLLKKTSLKGVFVIFFYLHVDEQGKTRSICRWQSTFPPWPRGKGNCLHDHPQRLTLVLGGSRTGQVQLRLGEDLILTRSVGQICPRSTQNSSQSWVWSAGKH